MELRTISLFIECPAIDALASTSNHLACLNNDTLHINKNSISTNVTSYQPILRSLIDEARVIEWQKKIREERGLIENIAHDLNLSPKEFFESLDNIAPEKVLTIANKSGLHLRTIEQIAKPIVERKTVFLVSENLELESKTKSQTEAIIKSIADEAVHLIENSSIYSDISFSFMPFNTRKHSNNHKASYHSRLLKQLLIQTSSINNLDKHNQNSNQKNHPVLLQTCFAKPGPMLLEGVTGTGKSLTAELLATNNNTSILYINISSISKDLLESRMRGFVKGTFTGAEKDRAGWFEEANNRVLFLDEFQNASLEIQAQLLDLLDPVSNNITVRKIGAEHIDINVSVKVVLAINEPLDTLIRQNRLRKDLYHRIRTTYTFPSLKSRFQPEQSPTPEITLFIKRLLFVYRWKSMPTYCGDNLTLFCTASLNPLFPRFENEMIEEIRTAYDWPGNFRELEIFAFDLYWQIDKENAVLNADLIKKTLANKTTFRPQIPDSSIDAGLRHKIKAVEDELIRCDFVISKVVANLKNYKLGSYNALKIFIKEHSGLFSQNILNDSKLTKLLK